MPRTRGTSAYEEANVTEFVKSCVDFKPNLTVLSNLPTELPKHVLVLFKETDQMSVVNQAAANCLGALWSANLQEEVACAAPGELYTTSASGHRFLFGAVPATSSRHNCPFRPDAITPLVSAALKDGKKVDRLAVLFISSVVGSDAVLPVAQAVAKGSNRSFSAKDGLAEQSYLKNGSPVSLTFVSTTGDWLLNSGQAEQLQHVVFGAQLCMRLVDTPPCLLDTTTFAEIAEGYATKLNFCFSEICGEALREQGYGGVYGVGKAAEFPPSLVTLSHQPNREGGPGGLAKKDKIALVGKGIVYDTGGLSLKPSDFMSKMKTDMGGAAAVFTGFLVCVLLGVDREIDCVLCLADNAVGPRSQRPDDIIRMKSGVTVEIANTDAEGRLVLGDGVFHAATACGTVPSVIVDMATLTGAQLITTGNKHAGIFASTEEWERTFVEAGRASGDLTFPMLYCPEFHNPQYRSSVADFKNLCTRKNAVSSTAGQFIANNIPKTFVGAHVHLDIAGPACVEDTGSGYGPALVAQLFSDCF